ncbi:putative proteinase inhibitor I3, Kunitz legume [Lupinus albus]|uniref:Kunitz type trypsin inhibitor / Alpha-fucosidase n=1 Tax=Lupinus albus TaxID=3870 RepID=A0A6A4NFM5_LUPAL|nr:putative proteinase inhibitor I3, Kunitz legume [Lupinus albus]
MKTSLVAFSFISFTLAITLLISITTAAPESVLDITGQKLKTGLNYNILPVIRGNGGGLTISTTNNNKTCPLYVVQEKVEILNGKSVTFTPYKANKHGLILTSTDLNIKSSITTTVCSKSPVWRLLKVLSGVWFLSADGVEGNPGHLGYI